MDAEKAAESASSNPRRPTSAPAGADFRLLFELAGVGMAQVDPYTHRFIHVNRRLAEMTGYSVEEFLGMTALELTHPDDRETNQAQWKKALQGESPQFALEKRYVRKDGRVIWVSVTATILRDEAGGPLRTVSSIQDITLSKEREEALRLSERHLRLALAAGQLGTWRFDFGGGLGTASERTCEIFGREGQGTITLEEWTQAIHPKDRQKVRQEFQKAAGGAGLFDLEYRILRPSGEPRWVALTGSLAKDAQGQPVSFDGVIADITERKQVEERQAFLFRLSDALRPLSNAVEIQATVARTAMNFFGADRCYYCEIEHDTAIIRRDASREDLPSVVGAYPLSSFPIFKAVVEVGRPFVVRDAYTTDLLDEALRQLCLQLQIISFIDVPVIKDGQPAGILCITQVTPREWTHLEIELAEETAERTWAAVERAKAEQALRQSEERYRELVAQVKDYAIFSTDPRGFITTWNEGCRQVLGYEPEAFIGMHFGALFPPEDRQMGVPEQELESAARLGACNDDRWMLHRNGERFWANGTTNAVRESSGKLTGFTKVMRDLTERVQAEATLRQSQERLALTLQAGGLGIWDSDLVSRRTYWSPEQERLFGLEPGRFDGHFSKRLHPEDRRRVLLRLAAALEGGSEYIDEYRVVWPDGTVRWLAARGRVYRDPDGRAVRILGVNYDITERRQAEAALKESEERFRVMGDHSPLMIWVTDQEGRVEYINRAYQEFFGVSTERVQRDGWPPLVHPDDQQGYTQAFLECLRERRTFWGQARVRHRSGEWRWVASYAAPRFSASGEFLGMVGSSPDISEIKQAEEQLKELVESQRRFVADASHELRAPLASVLGNLELLHRYPDMPQEDRDLALQDAYSEASRMSRLVHDLLALARGDEGLRLRHETVRLDTLLAEALRQARLLNGGHRLERTLEPLTVRGDPDRLKELFLILLDNALKYTPPGGIIRLELTAKDPPGEKTYAEVRVGDSGVGITPEDLPYVFERFYRADKARVRRRDPGGSGLGLSIAKQIVQAHHGEIRLESSPSKGTTVIVHLPILPTS